jgi:hypothetical protein
MKKNRLRLFSLFFVMVDFQLNCRAERGSEIAAAAAAKLKIKDFQRNEIRPQARASEFS